MSNPEVKAWKRALTLAKHQSGQGPMKIRQDAEWEAYYEIPIWVCLEAKRLGLSYAHVLKVKKALS